MKGKTYLGMKKTMKEHLNRVLKKMKDYFVQDIVQVGVKKDGVGEGVTILTKIQEPKYFGKNLPGTKRRFKY